MIRCLGGRRWCSAPGSAARSARSSNRCSPARGSSCGWSTGSPAAAAYVHDSRTATVEIASVPGHPLTRHELDELYNLALGEGLRGPVSVLSGPGHPSLVAAGHLPPARRRPRRATAAGWSPTSPAPHLAAVLDSGLSFLKVSHEELIRDGRAADDSEEELVRVLSALHADGAESVVVSRAEKPALALVDGEIFEIDMPRLQVADPRGAGDSMTAGVAAVLARGGDLELAVRTGAAAGALNVTRHGLGTGRPESITGLVDRVRLAPVGTGRQDRLTPDELAHRTTAS